MGTLEEQLECWDGECVVVRRDPPTGAWIFIAVHDRTLGMAMGGCRMRVYPAPVEGLRDAQRLAGGMTLKWAGIEFPLGGGKAVLAVPAPLTGPAREGLLLRFGDLVEGLGGMYGTGVDLGTTPADMEVVGRRTSRVAGRPPEAGGAGDPGPWTALGVFEGMRSAAARVLGSSDLAGRTVLVQGVGGVGRPLAGLLVEAGARVLVADADEARARAAAGEVGGEAVGVEAAYDVECDVFAPCAVGGVLNARTIPRLRCRIVAGSANNQLEEDADAARLAERGILYVPDFILNAGGAVAHGILEFLDWPASDVEPRVRRIGRTVAELLEEADQGNPLPVAIARARRFIAARERP
ncbi:MAG TPA: Glu/Leu/Phe/Val dehydrogenase dimerization domain-containing protein [Longimicrobiales bacterium]|nr:Glu/Leu/Phe/Val dehydrogenase dimerization domain-containing protein [Longimicrobiales bacterium]